MRRPGRVGLPRPTPAERLVAACLGRIAAVGITASAFDWDRDTRLERVRAGSGSMPRQRRLRCAQHRARAR